MEELSDAAKQMAFTDDLEKTQEERLNMFYKFVEVKGQELVNMGCVEIKKIIGCRTYYELYTYYIYICNLKHICSWNVKLSPEEETKK